MYTPATLEALKRAEKEFVLRPFQVLCKFKKLI